MKTFILLCLVLLSAQFTQATHLIGGYVQAKPVSGSTLTYEVTIALYLDQVIGNAASSHANSVSICFGDGTTGLASRQSQLLVLNKLVSLTLYRTTHTYSAPNTYALTVAIANRTSVQNITNASFQLFTLNTTISTNTAVLNQTPTPGFPASGFHIGVNQKATIALKATDAEGDSLAYGLAKPFTSADRDPCARQIVPSYLFPNDLTQKGVIKINNRTGELVWDAPVKLGTYSVDIDVYEYRNGILISQTTQEITLVVDDLPGTPSTMPSYEPAIEGTVITGITNYTDDDITLTTFPNPVDDWVQVVIQSSNSSTAVIRLMDMNGRKLHELEFSTSSRKHEQVISMDSLSAGIYLIQANVSGRSLLRKIVKK